MAGAADLNRKLGLRVDVCRLRRQHNRLTGPDQGVVELAEEQRLGGWVVTEFGSMRGVVPADTDDLHARDSTI